MIVHLIDGTYELFRHFYGLRRFTKGKDRPYGAVVGVLQTVLQMIDHVKGVASRGPDSWTQVIFRLRDFLAHAKLSHRKK